MDRKYKEYLFLTFPGFWKNLCVPKNTDDGRYNKFWKHIKDVPYGRCLNRCAELEFFLRPDWTARSKTLAIRTRGQNTAPPRLRTLWQELSAIRDHYFGIPGVLHAARRKGATLDEFTESLEETPLTTENEWYKAHYSFAELIEDPAAQQRLLAVVEDDVCRLDRLISDISDASRLDAELARAENEPVDLGAMLTALADAHPSVSFTRQDDGPLTAPGIAPRLVQVFENLIANGRSFSPQGGVIRITARAGAEWIEVVVEDDGPGIPTASFDAIFERFYKDRPAGEKFGTHSGLGLSISKQDRKSTRLNSSHKPISYAVFCLKKKKNKKKHTMKRSDKQSQ